MGFKDRVLALIPGHKATDAENDAAEPQDDLGLHTLYDGIRSGAGSPPAQDLEEDLTCLEPVDIVAVHGLGGGALSTWRHPESRTMWLQDLLPSAMPTSRIMSYGYDAKIYKSRSTLHMMDNAENLLYEVLAKRNSETMQLRPLIFVGHSLGGILIKKALCMAREEEKYQSLLSSTRGIMFMGTPHDGADAAKLASTLANIANSITTLNTNNLKTLERDSVPLQEISRSFGFLKDLKIVTVIESNKTQIPYTNTYTLIVPQPSARLNLGDRETVLSILNADHHMVCKFRGEEDNQYHNKIKTALQTLARTPSVAGDSVIHQIPYSSDSGFAGRTAILQDLSKEFSTRNRHTRIALYGLGGIGKSGIAIEFAHKFRRLWPHSNILWVRGASAKRFEQSYRSIAKVLALEGHDTPQVDVINLLKDWLMRGPAQWLLILDNADDVSLYFPDSDIKTADSTSRPLSEHIPQSPNGAVLITSRDKRTALQLVGNQPKNLIKVVELTPEDSLKVIRSRLTKCDYDDTDLSPFATMLGHIPLALTQACAYIEVNEPMTVYEYCAKFLISQDTQEHLLGKATYDLRRDPDIPNAVITTWQVSFEHLKAHDQFTVGLLSFLGVLDRQHIPRFLTYLLVQDQLKVDEALGQLLAFCLVRAETNNEYLEIHPLVEIALRFWMKENDELSHWLTVATLILDQCFPKDLHENAEHWPLCNALLPHAQRVIDTSSKIPEMRGTPLAAMLTYVAICLDNQFQLEEAAIFHQKAIDIAVTACGPEDPMTLVYQSNLAQTLKTQKKLPEAEIIYRHIWQFLNSSVALTKEYENLRFQIPNALSQCLFEQGNDKEAQAMHEHAYQAVIELRDEDDPEILRIMNNRALALSNDGRNEEAEKMGRIVVEKELRSVGPSNQMTLYSMKNLADYLVKAGKFAEAAQWIDRVISVEAELYPLGHPDRLATAKLQAFMFREEKGYSAAEEVLHEAYRDGKAFPQRSYVLMNVQADLATILDAQGKFFEAEEIAREVLASKQSLSSSLDNDTCNFMHNFADILLHVHKEKEAEELCWQVLEQYGDNGRPNIEGLSRQAKISFSKILKVLQIDLDLEPVLWCDKILKLQDIERIGGVKVFENRVKILSIVLAKLGCYTQGIELKARWRDKDDPTSLWLVNNLAEEYLRGSRYDEAKAILEPLVAEVDRLLGTRDDLTLSSMGFLAIAAGSHTEEGVRLLRGVIDNAEPNSTRALSAWHNLGTGYEKRYMCVEAFEAFRDAAVLADEHFDESDATATQVRNNWRQFLSDHVFEGPAPGTFVFRVHRPSSPNLTGSHEDNDENNNIERSASEEQSPSPSL